MRCVCGRPLSRWRDIALTVGIIVALGVLEMSFLERFALSVVLFATIYL